MPDLLVQYGVAVLFAWAFAVQAGLPLPAAPVLLGAGPLRVRPDESGAGHRRHNGCRPGRGRPLVCAGSLPGTPSVRYLVSILAGSGLSRPRRQGAIPLPSGAVPRRGQVSAWSEPACGWARRGGFPSARSIPHLCRIRRLSLGRRLDRPWLRLLGCYWLRGDVGFTRWNSAGHRARGRADRVPRAEVRATAALPHSSAESAHHADGTQATAGGP